MSVEARLQALQINLPRSPQPLGAYVSAVQAAGLLFLSGMLPLNEQRPAFIGRVGVELTIEEGRQAARLAALNGLAAAKDALGSLERLRRLVRLVVHVASLPDFGQHASVADGASELLTILFQDRGGHARLTLGASSLPALVPVELEIVFEVD